MAPTLPTCITCNIIFRTRHELEYHVKHDHQSSVKAKFQNGDVVEIKRTQDNTFKCRCGKSFKLPDSIRKHAKNCIDESMEQGENEEQEVLMNIDDSDVVESMDVDDRIIPADCFGWLISHETADCRGRRTS